MKILVDVGLWVFSAVCWSFCGYSFARIHLHKVMRKVMDGTDKIFAELGVNINVKEGKVEKTQVLSPIQTLAGVKLMQAKLDVIEGRMQVVNEVFDGFKVGAKRKRNSVQNPKG